jgi:hypothetical protein
MSSFIETSLRRAKMLREWRRWVRELCRVIDEIVPEAEVYVIGSVVRGDFVASSKIPRKTKKTPWKESEGTRTNRRLKFPQFLKYPKCSNK